MELVVRAFIPILRSFICDEDGPTAVEYAVMLAAILLAVVVTVGTLGDQVASSWGDTNSKFEAVGIK